MIKTNLDKKDPDPHREPANHPRASRYEKWIAAGRPKMDAWVKQGAGIGDSQSPVRGVQSSGLLQKRLKAEPTYAGRQSLMDRYDKWYGAGRPKMAEWSKQLADQNKKKSLQEMAKNKLTKGV